MYELDDVGIGLRVNELHEGHLRHRFGLLLHDTCAALADLLPPSVFTEALLELHCPLGQSITLLAPIGRKSTTPIY